jgi:hypothetical protein
MSGESAFLLLNPIELWAHCDLHAPFFWQLNAVQTAERANDAKAI